MKFFIAALMSLTTVSAFATDLASALEKIEMENNAKCTEVSRSRFQLCSGAGVRLPTGGMGYGHGFGRNSNAHLKTCRYSVKFNCVSNTEDFDAKIKVTEKWDDEARMRVTNVRKVILYVPRTK